MSFQVLFFLGVCVCCVRYVGCVCVLWCMVCVLHVVCGVCVGVVRLSNMHKILVLILSIA